ncbi:MAG: ring-hydroxylating oxygenase subunit alpha [Gammaproteobacteria bacterium]|nr:MAG: ring-hydroxylating oxygenase subunit alpha [Gammaproteobacteria bacterium]
MLSAEENRKLTETGPHTSMGSVFRAYWQPALLSRELETDGAPQRLRILGEDYVAFRDSKGAVGVLEPACSHRGANLFFGRNEDCGLRCVYHGWKFDIEGNCVDLPTSPPEIAERTREKAKIRALPVREWGDIVWVYLGEGDPPELPQFEFATLPETHRFVSKKFQQCNWAQAVEGGLDTAHFSYLHANIANGEKASLVPGDGVNEPPAIARFRWLIEDGVPKFTVLRHDAGLILGASRQADDKQLYWRLTQFLMPNHSLAPNTFPGEMYQGNTWVPVDDHCCWIYCYAWNPDRPLTDEERAQYAGGHGIFAEVDERYVPLRNRDNDYLISRERQKHSNFTGIEGISEQDAAIADSQGLIADRTKELLGQTDLGVVRFRQMMLEACTEMEKGGRPHGVDAAGAYLLRSGDAMAGPSMSLPLVVEERFGEMAGQGLTEP